MVANEKKSYAGQKVKISGKYKECRLWMCETGVVKKMTKGRKFPPHKIGAHWELSRKSK